MKWRLPLIGLAACVLAAVAYGDGLVINPGSGGSGVPSIAGTANQITQTGSPGATTLSIPSDFRLPGTINLITLTQPATAATFTLANNKTFVVNNSLTFAGTDSTTMTFPAASDTVAGLGTTQTLTGVDTFAPTAVASPSAVAEQWVPSVVGGTTNGAGANTTFNGSQGTGTGAAGKLIFQIAPKSGSSGSTQNAQVNALQISDSINSAFSGCCSNTTELDTAGSNEIALATQGLYWANGTTIGGGLRTTGVSAVGFSLCSSTCTGDKLAFSTTAPTISSGFGTTPSIVTSNGTAAFEVNVGTGGTATTGTIGMPTAANGWACAITDVTTQSATVFLTKQTGLGTTTTVPIGNFNTSGVAAAWVASDKLLVQCAGY